MTAQGVPADDDHPISDPRRSRAYLNRVCGTAALGGFLFGFDTAVISGTVGPLERQFELSALWLGWTVSSALLGCVLGAGASGWLSDFYGRKKALLVSGALFFVSAAGSAVAPALAVLVAMRVIGGLGVGIAGMVAPLYIAEISPPAIRGRMVALYQLAITIGVLCAYLSNDALRRIAVMAADAAGHESAFWLFAEVWRAMFGIEIVPAVFFLVALFFVPESPRYLAKTGRYEAAQAVLARAVGPADSRAQAEEIRAALAEESGSTRQLFTSGLKKATFIAIYLAVFSQLSGIDVVIYYGPKIFETAGFSFGSALSGQVIIGVVLVLFTLVALWKVDSAGRRALLFSGNLGVFAALLAMGAFFHWQVTAGFLLITVISLFIACFAFSLGPIPWIVMSEIFPTKVRGRAMALATLVLFGTTGLLGQVFPWLLESIGPAATFWLLASCTAPTFFFVWKVLPETKGRSLEEIERSWLRRPARRP